MVAGGSQSRVPRQSPTVNRSPNHSRSPPFHRHARADARPGTRLERRPRAPPAGAPQSPSQRVSHDQPRDSRSRDRLAAGSRGQDGPSSGGGGSRADRRARRRRPHAPDPAGRGLLPGAHEDRAAEGSGAAIPSAAGPVRDLRRRTDDRACRRRAARWCSRRSPRPGIRGGRRRRRPAGRARGQRGAEEGDRRELPGHARGAACARNRRRHGSGADRAGVGGDGVPPSWSARAAGLAAAVVVPSSAGGLGGPLRL